MSPRAFASSGQAPERVLIKAVIVDDEPPARRELQRLLTSHDNVHVVGDAGNLENARGLLARTRPDVVFLDIDLGGQDGFDLLDDVDPEIAVIFVTAFDAYAVRAFEAQALDYLVKPVEPERLAAAIARVESGRTERQQTATFTTRKWVFLESGDAAEFLEIARIASIHADRGTTRIVTIDGASRVSDKSLQDWELRLPPSDFARVHRSALVNLQHVERVEPWSNYNYRLFMRGNEEAIVMSRRNASKLRDLLG
jgi:two-component system LytT family response regulator